LVLHLDAANRKSYPGSGTAWTDLCGSSNVGTLTNGPTFDSTNNGSIVFDGTNDYVDLGSTYYITTTTPFTVNLWLKPNFRSPNGTQTDFHRFVTLKAVGTATFGIAYVSQLNAGYEGLYVTNYSGWVRAKTSYYPTNNVWAFLTLTYNGGGSTNINNFNIYWNTSQIAFNTTGVTSPPLTADNNTLAIRPDNTQVYRGNMSSFQIYNRALSVAEISQNFEAMRGRYGI